MKNSEQPASWGGQRAAFHNRVAWANTYLKKAGLLSAPRHGVFTITDRGKSVLAKNPPRIDRSFLEQFPEFLAFSGKSKTGSEADLVQLKPPAGIETPLESLEIAHEKIRKELKIELLDPRSLQIFVAIYLLIKPERGVRSSAKQLSG